MPDPATRNRDKLIEAIRLIEEIQADESVSPTPFEYLGNAARALRDAGAFVIDAREEN